MATISRSQEKVDEAYRRMKQDLKMETPPFHFIMGDITDLDFRRRMLEKNFHLVVILTFFSLLPTHPNFYFSSFKY